MHWSDIFNHVLILGLATAVWLYFTKFNNCSETELVRWSYIWFPLIIFGIVGNIALKKLAYMETPFYPAAIIAIKWTIVLSAGLIIFYEVFWDQL